MASIPPPGGINMAEIDIDGDGNGKALNVAGIDWEAGSPYGFQDVNTETVSQFSVPNAYQLTWQEVRDMDDTGVDVVVA